MTTYATLTVQENNPTTGSVAQDTTAQFTGSFFQTEAISNQVQLKEYAAAVNGSFYESVGAEFTGSNFGTVTGATSISLSSTNAALRVHYKFADSGTIQTDSALGYNGSMFSGAIAPGFIGSSYSGTTTGVNYLLASGASMQSMPSGTFMMWLKFNAATVDYNILSKNLGTQGIRLQYSSSIDSWLFILNGNQVNFSNSTDTGSAGVWMHRAWSWGNGSQHFFLNGSLIDSKVQPSGVGTGTNDVYWFRNNVNTNEIYRGEADDIRVYNKTFTANSDFVDIINGGAGSEFDPLDYNTTGSYLQTKNSVGDFYLIGSLVWNATSGANEVVFAQYRTAASGAGFGAWSSLSKSGVQVINGSNIGSVQVLFLLSGPGTTTPTLNDWNVNYFDAGSYARTGSYLSTLDLSGTSNVMKNVKGLVWHSGGVGPASVDYRFSNDLVTFTSYSNNDTGSVSFVNQTYRYVQLRFNLSGNGAET